MKTLVTILALQLLVGASAFARTPDEVESGLEKTSVAIAQSNFAEESPMKKEARVKDLIDEIEGGGGGGGGSAKSRSATFATERPTGNEWGSKGAGNR